jgi:hypothetical protein
MGSSQVGAGSGAVRYLDHLVHAERRYLEQSECERPSGPSHFRVGDGAARRLNRGQEHDHLNQLERELHQGSSHINGGSEDAERLELGETNLVGMGDNRTSVGVTTFRSLEIDCQFPSTLTNDTDSRGFCGILTTNKGIHWRVRAVWFLPITRTQVCSEIAGISPRLWVLEMPSYRPYWIQSVRAEFRPDCARYMMVSTIGRSTGVVRVQD